MLPDFALLPPEINSARMYAGPRAQTMWVAAAAWDGLAAQLGSAASSFQTTVSTLTDGVWQGPASLTMATAAAPYVQWLTATSAKAEVVANQARLSAGAFEVAFSATVPPEVVAANRALLLFLTATNFLGQNCAAIAATESDYAEMWAQDVAAMTGYDAAITAAQAGWTAFSPPPLTLTKLPTPIYTSFLQELLDGFINSLAQQLMNPMSQLQMASTPAQFAMQPLSGLTGQLMSGANPLLSSAGSIPAIDPVLTSAVGPSTGATPVTAQLVGSVTSASMGRADSIGALSVPASWVSDAEPAATPAPATAAVRPVAASLPATGQLPSPGVPGRLLSAAAAARAAQHGVPPRPAAG
ncbi:PPE family protein [Mycobacterium sherrisii]|uniref:PPE family protein n=1 Tax=Mycobacterium sherrisii TaxID=243061 RepID=UPI0039771DFD